MLHLYGILLSVWHTSQAGIATVVSGRLDLQPFYLGWSLRAVQWTLVRLLVATMALFLSPAWIRTLHLDIRQHILLHMLRSLTDTAKH